MDAWKIMLVLIVAKCIVNIKVYMDVEESQAVLIVAKCIVNPVEFITCISSSFVLIVAKCIVNHDTRGTLASILDSINSSKVYCKFEDSL